MTERRLRGSVALEFRLAVCGPDRNFALIATGFWAVGTLAALMGPTQSELDQSAKSSDT